MKVLVVDSHPNIRAFITDQLTRSGFFPEEATGGRAAVKQFQEDFPAAVVLATDLGDVHGIHVLKKMQELNSLVPVIIISPEESIPAAVKMVKAGAYDYIPKSQLKTLAPVVQDAIQIGESPEIVHEQMHTEGEKKGAAVHREFDRVDFRQEVKVDNKYVGKSINLSVGGMYVFTGRSHAIGQNCSLAFRLNNHLIEVEGIVRQCEFSVGMGVSFLNLTPEIQLALENFIANSMIKKPSEQDDKTWVMLVSEDKSALRMYKSQLMLKDFSILETSSMDKAAEYLRDRKIAVVVFDVDMQDVNVPQTIRSIKSVDSLSHIPLIAFTSSYKSDMAGELKDAGAVYFASRMTTPPKKLSEILLKITKPNSSN